VVAKFSLKFFYTIFARLPVLASPAPCGPHPSQPPLYATVEEVLTDSDRLQWE